MVELDSHAQGGRQRREKKRPNNQSILDKTVTGKLIRGDFFCLFDTDKKDKRFRNFQTPNNEPIH